MDIVLPDVNDPMSLINALKWAYDKGGWLCAAMFGVLILIRVYRTDMVQGLPLLPRSIKWDFLPQWAKALTSFLGAGLVAGIPVLVLGQGWWAIAIAILTAGLGSMFGHEGTKKVGQVIYKSATGKNPDYVPSAVRNMTSLIVPVPALVDGKLPEPSGGTARLDKPTPHGSGT